DAVVAELVEPRLQPTVDLSNMPAMMPVPGLTPVVEPEMVSVQDAGATEVASLETDPPAGEAVALRTETCSLDQIYNVIGFNENSNDLTPRLERRLDQIIGDIGDEQCRVLVTGYSSTQGDYATNALFAV